MQRDIQNYTYWGGRKVSHLGISKDPARRERDYRRVRPGGKPAVDGKAKTQAGPRRVENRQPQVKGYYA